MAEIKTADVVKLRKTTGAGMMDCKKALQEADGDFSKAIEIIRKKGQAIASKRADREAFEGVVLARVTPDAKNGAMLVLNCETDFVAKNEDFVSFAGELLDLALENDPDDLESLKRTAFQGKTVEEAVTGQVTKIGEKLDLSFYRKISAPQVIAYVHQGNQLASLVGLNKAIDDPQVGRDVAMQVAAMNPIAVDRDSVPQDIIDKEIEIGKEQARGEGKPEQLLEKIAMGKLNKFIKESTLLNQEFIKDNKKTVGQYLKEKDSNLTVTGFVRYVMKD